MTAFAELRTPHGWELLDVESPLGDGRNYGLFAVLADVRNGGRVPPIASPRGIPADVSPGGRQRIQRSAEHHRVSYSEFCHDDLAHHSHSWVLLSELAAYKWNSVDAITGLGQVVRERVIGPLSQYGPPDAIRVVFWFDS